METTSEINIVNILRLRTLSFNEISKLRKQLGITFKQQLRLGKSMRCSIKYKIGQEKINIKKYETKLILLGYSLADLK